MKYAKLILLIALFAVTGAAITMRPKVNVDRPTEAWLDTQVPTDFDGYTVQSTYKMDPQTYEILKAYGIISRFMTNGAQSYDSVFIASDNSESFHDPRICFNQQYNEILSQMVGTAHTKTVGDVPVTILILKNMRTNQINLSAYCFKGPGGYFADQDTQHFDLFKHELLTAKPQEGCFYRIIAQNPGQAPADKENLLEFTADYIDAIHTASAGRF